MVQRILAIALVLPLLSSCIYWKNVALTGRDHPSKFADQIRKTAVGSYEYAQMATNSYKDGDQFHLNGSLAQKSAQEISDIGFQYKIFHRIKDGKTTEIIIAYRGTDQVLGDLPGNFFLRQQEAGLHLFENQRTANPNIKITVTGHSLGGAIASHVTLNKPNVEGFFFNTSPRFRKGKRNYVNTRNSIGEYGEILKAIRLLGREPDQLYTSINCSNGGISSQHSSRNLAECLTWIAGWQNDGAKQSLIRNRIAKPDTRRNGPNVSDIPDFD